MEKIVTVVGARPQFVKTAIISKLLRRCFKEVLVHTGQHYDVNMSDVFFDELEIPSPDINLCVGSASHGEQTAKMIMKLERVFLNENPRLILTYGDTNSTLAATIAASKIDIPLAHVEAGVRAYDLSNPEEINRVVADKLSDYLFASTRQAVYNLGLEGIDRNVYFVGDVMIDVLMKGLKTRTGILGYLRLKEYALMTIHRQENTTPKVFAEIINAVGRLPYKVVFPCHPRTMKLVKDISLPSNLMVVPAMGYLDFITLQKNAKVIITDSGGVQKEAYFLKVPCVTVFHSSCWVETVEDGWNKLSPPKDIDRACLEDFPKIRHLDHYGRGDASEKIVNKIKFLCEY